MRKTMKYETPEIEITRFELDTNIMNVIIPGGSSGEDGDLVPVPGESAPDPGDLWDDAFGDL